jgi:tRNA A37 threonylcarbamoyladenosine synthetase subunit TsaC/SUA5/YrdC
MDVFLRRMAQGTLSILSASNMKATLVDVIKEGTLEPRDLYNQLHDAMQISEVIASVYGVEPLDRKSMVNTFLSKLDDEVRTLVLAERLRQNVHEASEGALSWHLDVAIVNYQSVKVKRKKAAAGLAKMRHEVVTMIAGENQALLQALSANASGQPALEYEVESTDSTQQHLPSYDEDADQSAGREVLQFIRQNKQKFFPGNAGKQPYRNGAANANPAPTNPASGPKRQGLPSSQDPVKLQRRKDGACIICGAPGPEQGGHWAKDCPQRQQKGLQATREYFRQLSACYPEQSEQFRGMLQSIEAAEVAAEDEDEASEGEDFW